MATAEEHYQLGEGFFFQKQNKPTAKQQSFVNYCVTQINLYKWISANQVPIQSRRKGNISFRGKTYAFELSSLDHILPFSQGRKWKTNKQKKKANRAGVLLVELWIGWSVATIGICFLGPCMRLLKKRQFLP